MLSLFDEQSHIEVIKVVQAQARGIHIKTWRKETVPQIIPENNKDTT